MHSRLAIPFARALLAVLIAGSTSGCATILTGIACAAGGGCSHDAMARAAEVDVRVGGAMIEAATSSSAAERSSSGGESISTPVAPPRAPEVVRDDEPADVELHVAFEEDERHVVQVFRRSIIGGSRGRKRVAACETPCRLTLAPDVYDISIDASLIRPLAIEAPPLGDPASRPIAFTFRSHEPRRIQGWTLVGSAVSAFGLLAVTSMPMAESLDEDLFAAHLIGTSLGLFSMLIGGVILALWPDELDAQISW